MSCNSIYRVGVKELMENHSFKVLVIARLADRTLDSYLLPIVSTERVRAHVLRSSPGTTRTGVSYICPPPPLQRSTILSFLWNLIVSIRLGLKADFSCVYAIFAYPHLYLASLIAFLARRPLFYNIIASDYELTGRGPVLQQLTIKLVRRANKVIATGERAIQYLLDRGIPSGNIVKYRVTNHIDLTNFFPMGLERPMDLIVVSRLVVDKNIEVFVDIVNRVKEWQPNVKAAIVGDGDLRNHLENYVRTKGLSENITFHGWLSSPVEINRVLNTAKIFVLNSSHEGGPFTIPEAMAAGLCPVSSDVGEVKGIIEHRHNGFLVTRYNDIDMYVSIIKELLDNPTKLERIQQRAAEIKKKEKNPKLRNFWKKTAAHLGSA